MEAKCIYCKVENLNAELSDEHIIPKILGGVFAIPTVCKAHNDRFGYTFEGELKKNSYIVTALDKLKLKKPNLAYSEAKVIITLENETGLKGYLDEEGKVKFFPQATSGGYKVAPEEETVSMLKKQIERFEKKSGKSISFNADEFDKLPYDIAIPVYGTDIVFIKRRSRAGSVMLHGLDQPIPFRVVAKIALNHLTALYYPFVMRDEFDAIKNYILFDEKNRFVILHTMLNKADPKTLDYLPYHYIRIKFVEGALVAIVCLFGIIKFMVFFGELNDVEEFKPIDLLDNYHVYDINDRNVFPAKGDEELMEWDDMLLRSVAVWGKYINSHPDEV